MTKSTASAQFAGTSVMEISQVVPLSKIAIGKPLIQSDGGSGHMTPETLSGCMKQAKGKVGVMYWQYHEGASVALASAIA